MLTSIFHYVFFLQHGVILLNLHVAVKLLLVGESKHVEGILGVEELLIVVDGVDLGLALGHVVVKFGVIIIIIIIIIIMIKAT